MPALPTGTVTFLFADIEGSTSHWEQAPESMQAALSYYDTVMGQAIEAQRGAPFTTIGGAFCAAFASAQEALLAAVRAQETLLACEWDELRLRVRMALHTDASERYNDGYVSLPLNRVARLLAASHGGQVLLSQTTYALLRDKTPAELGLLDLGEHRLRDLLHPMQIYQVSGPRLHAHFPPLKTLNVRETNLPTQPTALIGREQEVRSVLDLLKSPEVRLLTLIGVGGIGKTRLSLQVAADALDYFHDGVFFADLSSIHDAALVLSSIAKVLGVVDNGKQPLLQTLGEFLGKKKLLLVVDNFEQVLEAAPQIVELIRGTRQLKVLTTSRAVLQVAGERLHSVPPLELPATKQRMPVPLLAQYEAVRLFTMRAQGIDASFSLSESNAATIVEICQRLDGLPLAIELAAARISLLSPAELLERLSSRLKVLTKGGQDLPGRQQTLRKAIDWSYNLLEPAAQMLFRRLSIFRGWTLEAAERICKLEQEQEDALLNALELLLNNSLIRREATEGKRTRFFMLETIREYALELLVKSGELVQLRQRHLDYYQQQAEELEQDLSSDHEVVGLERFEQEHDNVRAALSGAYEQRAYGQALRIAGAIWRYWQIRGHLQEGSRWMSTLLGALGDEPIDDAVMLRAYWGAGWMAFAQAELEQARQIFTQGERLARAVNNGLLLASMLDGLGAIAREQARYEQAATILSESLTLFREFQEEESQAWTLQHLGVLALEQGRYGEAVDLLGESLAKFRVLSYHWPMAEVLYFLGTAYRAQGSYEHAISMYQDSGALFEQLGAEANRIRTQFCLGIVAFKQGDRARARQQYSEQLLYSRSLGDRWSISWALSRMAELEWHERRAERAARLGGAVELMREQLGMPLPAVERVDYTQLLAAAREQLGAARWDAAWQAGREMSWQEAVEYAIT